MNAVILGYGVVGKGIEILAKALDDINIKYVYVRKEKENLPYFSNNEDMVVQDDIDIVFECLNGLEPANTLIQKALKKGKHVISSNKAVVATYLDTYLELEKEYTIDNFGILALHTRIEDMQTLDHEVTISEVKDIVDDAIYYADKRSAGHFFDILFNKRYDEEDMIILREKDFMH